MTNMIKEQETESLYTLLTPDTLEQEHLCCAISDVKHQSGVASKKQWLKERIQEGHVFLKRNVKGKVFIEYAPLETAWTPIEGDQFLYIYCLWVAGSFKGNGYGKELLDYAIIDAKKKGKKGICTISSKKKKPFLSEKKFFEKYGFVVVDQIGDYELLSLSFSEEKPHFLDCARKMEIEQDGLVIYYSPQCPFTAHSIQELEEYSKENALAISFLKVDTREKARQVPCIFQNWATFQNRKFVSNTILNANMVEKLIK